MECTLAVSKVNNRRVAHLFPKKCPHDRQYGSKVWHSLMVDNGANTDVVGLSQLRAFETHKGLTMPFRRQTARINNAGGSSFVVGKAVDHFPLPLDGSFEEFSSKVLDGDAPMLIEKPLISAMGWHLCEFSNTIKTYSGRLSPVHQWNGHLFCLSLPCLSSLRQTPTQQIVQTALSLE